MHYPVSVFIGLRYLRGRSGDRFSRFVSMMSTLGIGIGVMALVTVLSVMNGFESQLKDKILGVLPQAVVSQEDGQTDRNQVPEFLSQYKKVTHVAPLVRGEAVIQSPRQISAGMLIGIEPTTDDPINQHLMMGRINALQAGRYQVFLGHSLARNLDVNLGDEVRILVTSVSQYTPLGRIPSQRNFTVAGIFNTGSDVDASLMVTHIQDAGRLLRMNADTISGWRLFYQDPFDVTTDADLPLKEGWQWSDWREQRGEFFQAVRMEKNMMSLMLLLIIAVAAFNIISALIMVVMEKQAEVAILKTQGMSDQKVLAIFMIQGATSGVFGAVIGGILGTLIASNLNQIMSLLGISLFEVGLSLPVLINPVQIISVILLAVMLSLVATIFPAYRASKVKPAQALRYE